MNKYIKDSVIYNSVTSVILNGKQIINPSEEKILLAGYEIYVEPEPTDEEKLEITIENKIKEIEDYDISENVNIFYYGDTACWLDKDTRVGLMNSTTIEKNAGRTTTKLILEDLSFELPVDTVLSMLAALELYAKDCYDVTAQHKINVKALTTIEDVEAYDYTTGYPEKLTFSK